MYRRLLVALMVVAMLAMVAAPAFAEPPVPGGDMDTGEAITEGLPPANLQVNRGEPAVTIYMYYWLNLLRGQRWSVNGRSHVLSQAYNASSHSIRMQAKNRLCRRLSCSVWVRTNCSSCVWVWAGWSRRGSRTVWTTRGIHTFWPFGSRRLFRLVWGAPL